MISYLLFYITIFMLLLSSSAYIIWAGYRKSGQMVRPPQLVSSEGGVKEVISLAALIAICYLFLACLLRQSWLQGDEWWGVTCGNLSIHAAVKASIMRYLKWVSRVGEIGAGIMGLSITRWQEWVITPFFASLAPLALFSLVRRKEDTIFSTRGRMFYLTAFVLFMLSVYLPRWRNYWCYAAAWNYLYPSVALMYFLSFYRRDARCFHGSTCCVAVAFLGLVAAWGTECTSCVLFPILTCIVIYNLRSERSWLPFSAYTGYCGYAWGTAALFCSPALYLRSKREVCTSQFNITDLTFTEYQDFIHHLDWDSVNLLKGGSGIIALKDIPFFDRIYFLPFIGERFLLCSCVVLTLWVIFAVVYYVSARGVSRRRIILSSCAIGGLALAFAFSYSIQCIPTPMSFLPAGFAIVAACMFIYTRFCHVKAMFACCACVLILGCIIFVPAGIQAAQYKDVDCNRFREICAAKQAGELDVVLSTPTIELWFPSLGLIAANDIKDRETAYPNVECAHCFSLASIKQSKAKIKRIGALPMWIFPDVDKKMFENSSLKK